MYLFWSKVIVKGLDECWLWTGAIHDNGYAYFSGGRRFNLPQKASRTSYLLTHGDIPEGLHILHSCDNPRCVNPLHLRADTRQANMDDMKSKQRQASGTRNSQTKLTTEQVEAIRSDGRTLALISAEYGVSRGLVSKIKSGHRR